MTDVIAKVYSVGFFVIGVSHFVNARLWTDFFAELRTNNRFAALLIGMFTLPIGLLLIIGHNIWLYDVRVLITIFGWIMTLKSVVYLWFPKSLEKVIPEKNSSPIKARIVGAIMIVLGAFLIKSVFFGPAR
jgi:hypothetical protein